MRVEFVGLPAAGKTQACKAAHSALRRSGIAAKADLVGEWRQQRRRVVADYASLVARGQVGVTASSAKWMAGGAVSQRGAALPRGWGACAYLIAVDAHIRGLDPTAVWLHDQGTVQALWSVAMRTGADMAGVTAHYQARISWPDLLVEVQAPVSVLIDRLAQREVRPSSLPADGSGELEGALLRGQRAMVSLRQHAEARSLPWLALPCEDDAAELLAARIRSSH